MHIPAIEFAKRSFQVCATAPGHDPVLFTPVFSRAKLETVLRPGTGGMCYEPLLGAFAQSVCHEVRLIPPPYVKPFVKRQKNYAADAAAIAEAALRPNMHDVAVKSAEHPACAVALRTHQSFVGQRTQLIKNLRGHLGEFGLIVAQGPTGLKTVAPPVRHLTKIAARANCPQPSQARQRFAFAMRSRWARAPGSSA